MGDRYGKLVDQASVRIRVLTDISFACSIWDGILRSCNDGSTIPFAQVELFRRLVGIPVSTELCHPKCVKFVVSRPFPPFCSCFSQITTRERGERECPAGRWVR